MRRATTMRATGSGQGVAGSRSEAGGWEATMDGERGRRRIVAGLRCVVLAAVLALSAGPGWAVHDLNLLKLDGTATATPVDWNDINPPVGGGAIPPLSQSGASARVFVPQCVTQVTSSACVPPGTNPKTVEDPNGDGTFFTGGGSKDDQDTNQWLWSGT